MTREVKGRQVRGRTNESTEADMAPEDAEVEVTRQERVPMGAYRDILTVHDKDPNYVYRFFNDIDNRIERAKQAGYEIVDHKVRMGAHGVANNQALGGGAQRISSDGVPLVLMRIRREWWEEDQAAKQKIVNDRILTINKSAEDGYYGETKTSRK